MAALERHLEGEYDADVPRGGHHVWATLKRPVDERDAVLRGRAPRHVVHARRRASPPSAASGRACGCRSRCSEPEELDEGCRRLARALREVRRRDRGRGGRAPQLASGARHQLAERVELVVRELRQVEAADTRRGASCGRVRSSSRPSGVITALQPARVVFAALALDEAVAREPVHQAGEARSGSAGRRRPGRSCAADPPGASARKSSTSYAESEMPWPAISSASSCRVVAACTRSMPRQAASSSAVQESGRRCHSLSL